MTRLHSTLLRLLGLAVRPVHYRGFARAADLLKRAFPPSDPVEVTVPGGGRLLVSLHDTYWSRLVAGYNYEPEMERIIRAGMRLPGVRFLDLGANVGYWSVVAARIAPGRAVAVEASPPMREQLARNAALNGGIDVLPPVAVWSCSGETVEIVTHPVRHAGASITNRGHHTAAEGYERYQVPTLTVDDIVADHAPDGPLLVKLDVEGVEIPAVDGAKRTLAERDVVLLYEDHGQDPTSAVTAHILGLGMVVVFLNDDGTTTPVTTAADASARKHDAARGYNFAAHRPDSGLASALLPG